MQTQVESIIDANKLFDNLVINGLDFLKYASEELKNQPKYSLVHFCTGLELFLKARLMLEHWSLIVVKIEDADYTKFQAGKCQSVSISQAIDRLEKIANEPFSKAELQAYYKVRDHRNQVMHFFPVETSSSSISKEITSIVAEQCRAWYFLDNRLRSIWSDHFGKHLSAISLIREKIHENRSYLQVKFDKLKPAIEACISDGGEIINCHICEFNAVEVTKNYGPLWTKNCRVCENCFLILRLECPKCSSLVFINDIDGEECTKCGKNIDLEVLLSIYGPDEDPKEDSRKGYCGYCEYHSNMSVIPVVDTFLCLNCLETSFSIEQCSYCGEQVMGIDQADSSAFGCMRCKDAINWD